MSIKKPHLETCNLCRQQSLIYYRESTDHDEKEILLPKIMAKRLFDEVDIISPMKILKMNQLDFKCYIASDDFRNMKKIADLISDSDDYYYIYLNTYQ